MINSLSILIPAYNEANTIISILDKVLKVELMNDISKEIIVIDDCSDDGTYDLVKNYIKENNGCDATNFRC